MILLDAVIAYYLPAKRVETRLLSSETIKKLTSNYGRGFLDAIKPQTKAFEDKITTRMESDITKVQGQIESKIHDEVATTISNHIPHIIDEQLKPFNDKLEYALYQMDDIRSRMGSVLSSGSGLKRSIKKAETIYRLQSFVKDNPNMKGTADIIMMLYSSGHMKVSEINKMLDMYQQVQGFKDGGFGLGQGLQEMPALQAGTYVQKVPQMQEKGRSEETNMGSLTEAQGELKARNELSALGVPKEVLDYTFSERKKTLLAQKVKDGEKNGKTQEKEKERERKELRDRGPGSGPEDIREPGDSGSITEN